MSDARAAAEFAVRIETPRRDARGAIDPAASLEMFRRVGDDLIDRWDGRTLLRTHTIGTRTIAYACAFASDHHGLTINVTIEDVRQREAIEDAVRTMFVTPGAEFIALVQSDRVIGVIAAAHPGVRSVRQSNLLHALIRCISAQQVNLRWAATCRRRLAGSFGREHRLGEHRVYSLDAARLAALEPAAIRALQFTTRKAEYIINVARALAGGELTIAALAAMSDDEVIARLTAIRGVGLWTAEWILARTLGRPRVVAGDLGVRKAIGLAYCGGAMPAAGEVHRLTAAWGAAAATAQAMLLHALAEKTLPPGRMAANAPQLRPR
ncbi:MAG: DNA-3-methyladenine glycosylase 2 family protein [Candidatus Binataceae bacterium]|nr:DNA-3-methyladenine glycosylase 2 family protein [Candidatus Binataceae bacterium]